MSVSCRELGEVERSLLRALSASIMSRRPVATSLPPSLFNEPYTSSWGIIKVLARPERPIVWIIIPPSTLEASSMGKENERASSGELPRIIEKLVERYFPHAPYAIITAGLANPPEEKARMDIGPESVWSISVVREIPDEPDLTDEEINEMVDEEYERF